MKSRGENITPMSWDAFQTYFLDRYFPREMREANIEEFMEMRQGST